VCSSSSVLYEDIVCSNILFACVHFGAIMIFLCPELLKELQNIINYAYFLRVLPFKWNKHSNGVQIPRVSRLNFYRWEIIIWFYLAHEIIISIKFFNRMDSILVNSSELPSLAQIIGEGLYFVGYTLVFALQLTVLQFKDSLTSFLNQFIHWLMDMQGT